jgi:hypothetical protein
MTEDRKTISKLPVGAQHSAKERKGLFCTWTHPSITKYAKVVSFLLSTAILWTITPTAAVDTGSESVSSIRTERIPHPDYWQRMGYAEMVPSLRLPTTHDASDIVRVYLRVPPGHSISARYLENQERYTLLFPAGTRADRVEFMGYRSGRGEFGETPMDVRGTLIEGSGRQRFHCLRPESGKPLAPLLGWSWSANDTAARKEATRRIMALAARVGTPIDGPPLSGDALRELGHLNDCAHCHIPNHRREASVDTAPFPRRETDASGFYVPLSVLHSEAAMAATRPLDPNAGDPYVDVRCGKEPARLIRDGDWIWYRCADGSVPVGRRDVRSALAAGDQYTTRVCQSRRYLHDHMDRAARQVFADSFRECGIRSPEVDELTDGTSTRRNGS